MDCTFFRDYASDIVSNGYSITPLTPKYKSSLNGFDSFRPGWRPMETQTVNRVKSQYPDAGVGIACGRFSVAFDFDTTSQEMNNHLLQITEKICGKTPLLRQGNAPKIAALYRASEPIISARIPKMDVLGLGVHLASYGYHPKTKQPYKWLRGHAPHDTNNSDVPAVDNDMVERVLNTVCLEMYGNKFSGLSLEIDRNFIASLLSSRSFLSKQLIRRILTGKQLTRDHIIARMYDNPPTGCWGLVRMPKVEGGANWHLSPNGTAWAAKE